MNAEHLAARDRCTRTLRVADGVSQSSQIGSFEAAKSTVHVRTLAT
jgi:hypothetical protein